MEPYRVDLNTEDLLDAIAERANATLLTLDRRLAQAHGPCGRIEVLGD
jgi:predicted nucleic acid-binding protein